MPTARFALVPDRTWDGVSDHPVAGTAIVISGESIERVVPAAELPKRVRRVRAPGCTALPGMVDMHTHYTHVMGRAFLAAGVTTIRDVGNDLDWIVECREATRRDPATGPDIICTGFLVDAEPPFWSVLGRGGGDEEAVRQRVREQCAGGVDEIKLYAKLPLDLLRAGAEEAHAHDKRVLAHLGGVSAEEAARAGVDEVQHLSGCSPAWKSSTVEEDDALLDVLLAHGVVLTPTLVVWDRIARQLDLAFRADARRRWVHPTYLELWDRRATHDRTTRLNLQESAVHLKRFLLRAYERGMALPTGTDTPWINLVPGFSLHDELSFYVDAGIPCVDALRFATSAAARVIGRESVIGSLAPGMQADIVVVCGDPLARIADIANVQLVVHRGRVLAPADLLAAQSAGYATPALAEPQARQWGEMQG